MIRPYFLLATAALSGCVGSVAAPAADTGAPSFAPITFFAGRTHGDGRLSTAMSSTRTVRVDGRGTVAIDGTLTLVQHIAQEGKPDRSRIWFLRPTAAGSYDGTLTDAVGRVSATVDGNLLHIRFKATGGLDIEQWLALRPGGRVARNHLVARKFGVRVAVLDETIRKLD